MKKTRRRRKRGEKWRLSVCVHVCSFYCFNSYDGKVKWYYNQVPIDRTLLPLLLLSCIAWVFFLFRLVSKRTNIIKVGKINNNDTCSMKATTRLGRSRQIWIEQFFRLSWQTILTIAKTRQTCDACPKWIAQIVVDDFVLLLFFFASMTFLPISEPNNHRRA